MTCGLLLSVITISRAQISGVFTVPGSYTSVAAAIVDLNTQGVNGPVTINVAAGYTETAPVGGFTLTATGTSANPIVFQKSGAGTNPLITAYTGGVGTPGTASQDGVWRLVGSDYITIDGIDITDPNTINPSTMEFGYGLFKASVTDGCQNNTIKNCVITLNKDNNAAGTSPAVDGSRGIDVVNALTGAHTSVLTITSAAGSNSNNKFYGNTIQNCNIGIAIIGFADVTPFTFADTGNDIGGASMATGNTIINYGGAAAATNPAAAIRTLAQYNINVSYNAINNNNGAGVNHTSTLRGIYLNTAVSANATINNNTLTVSGGTTTSQVSVIENASGSTAANNTITINNNLITNCTNTMVTTGTFYGVYNSASCAYVNLNNNTFTNNSSYATSGATYLVYNSGAVTLQVNMSNNNLGFSFNGPSAYTGTMYNVYNSSGTTGTSVNITNNIFSSYNHAVTGTGAIYFVYNTNSSANLTIGNNLINNLTLNHSGTEYCFYNGSSTQNSLAVVSNSITNFTRNASAGTMYCYYAGSSSLGTSFQTFSNNLFSNITATTSGSGTFYGFYNSDGASSPYPKKTLFNNVLSNINYNTTGTFYCMYTSYLGDGSTTSGTTIYNNLIDNITSSGTIYGLYMGGTASPTYTCSLYTNTVSNVTSNGSSSTIYANYISGGAPGVNFFKNRTYNITHNGATGTLYGMYITSTLANIYNNLVGNLFAPNTTGANKLNGMYVSSGTTDNIYYNTVYLNATSIGANFGSNAIYAATGPNVNLRNNIFVNNSTPTGTEYAAAYRRSSTTLTTYSSTSNNNLFYAGTPGPNNVIYYDGTTAQQTLGAFKTVVAPRDAVSVTENPTFVSTVGNNPNFLNISTSVPTQIESGAAAIAGITDDYAGTIRNVSTPDIGAWEGTYVSSGDILPPAFLASGFTSPACNLTSRTYTMNITDVSGVAGAGLSPRVYYNVNNGPYTSTQGTLTSGTPVNGVWTFSMSYAGNLNDVIYYYTVAQDIATTPNLGATPGTGFSGTSVNSITTPPTTPNTFTLVGTLTGTYTIGATGNFTTLTQAAIAYNNSCLAGPITYVLIDPNYSTAETFPIVFNNSPYASATNSLLIIPANAMNVSITATSTANSAIKFLNARYITIDGLNTGGSSISITNPNTSSEAVIWLASTTVTGPGNNTIGIKNLTLTGGAQTSGNYGILAGVDGANPSTTAGMDNDNISITGNAIYNAYHGIYATGSASASAGAMDNLVINNNHIGPNTSGPLNIANTGIYLGNANLVSVTNNTISNVQGSFTTYEWGVNLTAGVRNATVSLNTINSIKYLGTSGYGGLGIDVNVSNTAANITIQNNMISDITGDGWSGFTAGAFAGIRVASGSASGGLNIYNNSVAMNQFTTVAGYNTSCNTAAIYFGSTATNIDVRDNIFYSDIQYSTNAGSKTYAIYSAASATAFTNINYNDYYTGASSQGNLAYMAAASQTNLAMIVSSFGQNANSQNVAPQFTGLTDLHLVPATNAFLDNTGTPIAGVTIDIDNQTRNVTTPDVGADEFTAPTCTNASAGVLTTNSYSICNGQLITLASNSVSTGAGTVYQWQVATAAAGPFTNVTGGTGANTPSFITSTLTTGTLYYQLQTTCTSLSLTSVSNMATVAINPIPTASVSPMAPICAGQNLTFTSTTNIGNTFTWTGPAGFTSSAQNPVIANATSSATGVYTLVVSAAGCSATAVTTTATVNSTNLSIQASPITLCSSGSSTLVAVGNATSVTWSSGPTTNTIVVSPSATTMYTVVGTGTSNCVATAVATITVINPTITGVGAVICNTTAIATLSATSFGPISWYGSPTSTTVLGTGNTFTATAATTTTYYAQANSFSSDSLFTTLAAGNGFAGNMFDIVALNSINVNAFDMHFSSTGTATMEVWYRVGSFVGFESSNTGWTMAYTTTLTAMGTGVLTQMPGSFTVNVPAGQTYGFYVTAASTGPQVNYTNGTALNNIYVQNSDLKVLEGKGGGYFSVTNSPRVFNGQVNYSKAGCMSPIIPVTLTVSSQPTITIGASQTTVCPGTPVNIGVTGANTYTWSTSANGALISPTVTATTNYSVIGENAPGCSSTVSITISTYTIPAVGVTSSNSIICVGQTASLTANGASTYSWSTSSTNSAIAVSPTVNTTYTVTGIAANTCSASVAFTQSVSTCTGIDSKAQQFSNSINVYPNPSNGLITAEFGFDGEKEITVTNSMGQIIMVVKTKNYSEVLDLKEYAKGVYFVKVMSKENSANYRMITE